MVFESSDELEVASGFTIRKSENAVLSDPQRPTTFKSAINNFGMCNPSVSLMTGSLCRYCVTVNNYDYSQ